MWLPQDQVFWYLNHTVLPPLKGSVEVDVAIVGGGMAGLSAAQAFAAAGKKVALVEQYYCGAGASGKSSGFITPNAELSLSDFAHRYSREIAQKIWDLFTRGVEDIRQNIQNYAFDCDYAPQDTLVVANNAKAFNVLKKEYELLKELGYKSELHTQKAVKNYIGSDFYYGGVGYEDSFGINGYRYCQELKKFLQQQGVLIFEESPVLKVTPQSIITSLGNVQAEYLIFCMDQFLPDLNLLADKVYHAQTFLLISQPLEANIIQALFPQKPLMVWDTDLIYTYYRVTGDNRLLLGGGSLLTTYAKYPIHDSSFMYKKLTHYFKKKFPRISLQFEQLWPGLIGLSKDIVPLAGPDKDHANWYYISACAGLPIAAALGRYSAEHIVQGRNDLNAIFNPYRGYFIGSFLQKIIGKKASFALSNMAQKIS